MVSFYSQNVLTSFVVVLFSVALLTLCVFVILLRQIYTFAITLLLNIPIHQWVCVFAFANNLSDEYREKDKSKNAHKTKTTKPMLNDKTKCASDAFIACALNWRVSKNERKTASIVCVFRLLCSLLSLSLKIRFQFRLAIVYEFLK